VAVVEVTAVVLVLTMMVWKATIEAFLQMPRMMLMMLDDPRHQRRFLQSRLPKKLPNQYQPVPRILQPLQMSRNTRTKRSLATPLTSWYGGGGSVISFRSQQQR